MMTFLKQHAGAMVFSTVIHLVLLGLLGITLDLSLPQRPPTRLAIEAMVVDSSILTAKQRQQEEVQRQIEAEARQQREAEAAEEKRQQELAAQREQEEMARQQAEIEAQRQAEADRKAQAEAERKAREEAERQAAEEKRKAQEEAERQAAEQKRKAQEEAERQAAEQKRKAEEAAKRKQEEQRRQEEAQLRAALAAEEELLALQQSDAMNQYQWQIQQRIERSWIRPPTARVGLSCELNVIQLASGDVIDVRVGRCNGDDVVIRSLEAAVLRASPLPVPSDSRLYSRNLKILFEPQQ